jgi:hypothetical protein
VAGLCLRLPLGAVVERVESFKFLGVHITKDLSWSKHTNTVVKWARQHHSEAENICLRSRSSKSCTIGSILTGCITAWYGNCLASDCKALQRVVLMAKYIAGAGLPAIQDLYTRWCQMKALKIVKDSSHPSHGLFCYRLLCGSREPTGA